MGQLPNVPQPGVAPSLLGDVSFSTNAPMQAFGAGPEVDKARSDAGNVVDLGLSLEEKAKADQDQLRVQKHKVDFLNQKNGWMQTALSQKGENAFAAVPKVDEAFDKTAKDMSQDLQNDSQKKAFDDFLMEEKANTQATLSNHVAQQRKELEASTTAALVANYANDASTNYADLAIVARDKKMLQDTLDSYHDRQGLPATNPDGTPNPQRVADSRDQMSTFYRGIILQSLANKNIDLAKEYLSHANANQELTEADREKLDHAFKASEVQSKEDLYTAATNLVEKSPGINPAKTVPFWDKLPLDQREALDRRANAPGFTDSKAWLDFLQLTPKEVGNLTRSEFESKYWSKFDGPDRAKAENQWNTAMNDLQKPDKASQQSPTITFEQDITSLAREAKIIPNKGSLSPSQQANFNAFRSQSSAKIHAWEENNGKKATTEERMAITRSLISDVIVKDKGWFGRDSYDTKKSFQVPEGEFSVPVAESEKIKASLEKAGKSTSKEMIFKVYKKALGQ